MTKQELLDEIDELVEINGKPYAFFLVWNSASNIENRDKDKFENFKKYLDKMEQSTECIAGLLPFKMLCIYFNTCVLVFKLDENWSCVNDESWESHDIYSIPFIDMNSDWLYLNGSPATEYIDNEQIGKIGC